MRQFENLVHSINSKYFEISGLNNFKTSNDTMFLFQMNIRSLSAHHDKLSLLLAGLKFKVNAIGISETKEQSDRGFLTNVHLLGYNIHTQSTKSSAGAWSCTIPGVSKKPTCLTDCNFASSAPKLLNDGSLYR